MANLKSTTEVQELTTLLKENSHFALVKYERTTHKSLESLRRELKKSQAKVRVVKNTLFEKAIDHMIVEKKDFMELKTAIFPLKESTAVIILGEDYAPGLSAFFKFAKADKTMSFKFGILDNHVYMGADLEKIAQLPGKAELIAKLIGGLKAAPYKLTYSMKFNVSKLTLVLKERAKQAN